jgi:hypothetical protein
MDLSNHINEDLLYFVWKNKTLATQPLTLHDGRSIEIIDFGVRNQLSGPDFTNCKVKIEDIIWAGTVEMHVKSSDWIKHNHQQDKAYENVILHVVYIHDQEIDLPNQSINRIPVLEMYPYIEQNTLSIYKSLKSSNQNIPCVNLADRSHFESLNLSYSRLAIERLEEKVSVFESLLTKHNNDWNEALYIQIAKYFGGPTNKSGFERLASLLSYQIISKNKYNPLSVEALLFGVAGFLECDEDSRYDEYNTKLSKEYTFLKSKYQLSNLAKVEWKYGKMLPSGFPSYRISQMASIFINQPNVASKVLECRDIESIYKVFNIAEFHEYWSYHYVFGKPSKEKSHSLTNDFKDRLIINALVPFYFAYGKLKGEQDYQDLALDFLDQLKAEKNTIVDNYNSMGAKVSTALDTQAILQLRSHYCDKKRCLDCQIGAKLLR